MPFVRPEILEGIELSEEQKRELSKNFAKQQMNNFDLNEEERKEWKSNYSKFLKEDVKRQQTVFDRLIEKAESEIKDFAGRAGQALNRFSEQQ